MAAAPPPPQPSRDPVSLVLLRILLVLMGFVLVWLMEDRWTATRAQWGRSFEWPMLTWLAMVGLGVLAGVAFGLAVAMPRRFGGYRWGRALVLGIPGVLIVGLGIATLGNLEGLNGLPDPVADAALRLAGFYAPFLQPVAALVIGLALASGFAEPRPRRIGFSPAPVAGSGPELPPAPGGRPRPPTSWGAPPSGP